MALWRWETYVCQVANFNRVNAPFASTYIQWQSHKKREKKTKSDTL